MLVAGSSPVASCAATLTNNLLFLGSAVGDSLLVRYTSDSPAAAGGPLWAAAAPGMDRGSSASGAEHPAKRRRLASLASIDMGGGVEGDRGAAGDIVEYGSLEDEGQLYRCAIGRSHSSVLPVLLGDGLKQNLKVSQQGMQQTC